MPRATQCQKCWAVGHVIGIFVNANLFSRCGGSHDQGCYTSEAAKCMDCNGTHDTKPLISRKRQQYSNGCLEPLYSAQGYSYYSKQALPNDKCYRKRVCQPSTYRSAPPPSQAVVPQPCPSFSSLIQPKPQPPMTRPGPRSTKYRTSDCLCPQIWSLMLKSM